LSRHFRYDEPEAGPAISASEAGRHLSLMRGGESMNRRVVRALDLIQDAALIAAYEAHHAPKAVPGDVVRDLRDRGYREMEIWRVADRLVMIAEVEDAFPLPPDPSLQPSVQAWERTMDGYQQPIMDGPKWADMTRIFALSEQ
jgi:L-rhamnose mutarotase